MNKTLEELIAEIFNSEKVLRIFKAKVNITLSGVGFSKKYGIIPIDIAETENRFIIDQRKDSFPILNNIFVFNKNETKVTLEDDSKIVLEKVCKYPSNITLLKYITSNHNIKLSILERFFYFTSKLSLKTKIIVEILLRNS